MRKTPQCMTNRNGKYFPWEAFPAGRILGPWETVPDDLGPRGMPTAGTLPTGLWEYKQYVDGNSAHPLATFKDFIKDATVCAKPQVTF